MKIIEVTQAPISLAEFSETQYRLLTDYCLLDAGGHLKVALYLRESTLKGQYVVIIFTESNGVVHLEPGIWGGGCRVYPVGVEIVGEIGLTIIGEKANHELGEEP